jgi:hypothetical protein
MKGTAPKLQLAGETRSPPRKVKLTQISRYSPSGGGSSFFNAHRKAQDEGTELISIRTGVRFIHAFSNPGAYGEKKELESPKGMLIPTPGLEMFLEGEAKRNLPVLSEFAFWNGGLLVSSGGKRFGSEIVVGPDPWCKTRNIFQVPKELENASGISLIYEPGTWSFYEDGNEILYLPKQNARPVWIPESAGAFNLSILDKGTDLAKEELPPDIKIFVFSRGMEWVGPTLCALAPNDHRSIRISALVLPTYPMGAILEAPWEGMQE